MIYYFNEQKDNLYRDTKVWEMRHICALIYKEIWRHVHAMLPNKLCGKLSAMCQPTRPSQPSIPPGYVNE